jgi:hypothetical protein
MEPVLLDDALDDDLATALAPTPRHGRRRDWGDGEGPPGARADEAEAMDLQPL